MTPEEIQKATEELARATSAKPGYKSTEFYLSVAAAAVGFYFASGAPSDTWLGKAMGLAAVVLSALGYTVARTMAKRGGG